MRKWSCLLLICLLLSGRAFDAEAIEVYRAKEIEQYQGKSIDPNGGKAVERRQGKPAHTQQAMSFRSPPVPEDEMQPKKPEGRLKRGNANGLNRFFGVWRTNIPGAVWESPGPAPGYNRLHISPGAEAGDLTIFPDGRYAWNSYGGKKGRWKRSGDSEYPLVLIDTAETKEWKVGVNRKAKEKNVIIIWDGYVWYKGRK